MNRQQYANRLFNNRIIINEIQEDTYPKIYRFLHERSGVWLARLLFLLETIQQFMNQERDTHGYWCILPYSRLAELGSHVAKSDKDLAHDNNPVRSNRIDKAQDPNTRSSNNTL